MNTISTRIEIECFLQNKSLINGDENTIKFRSIKVSVKRFKHPYFVYLASKLMSSKIKFGLSYREEIQKNMLYSKAKLHIVFSHPRLLQLSFIVK